MKKYVWFVFAALALLLFALIVAISSSTSPVLAQGTALDVVQTDAGLVAPARDSTADVRIFKMIPYAAPPVSDLRWKPPQPVTPWQGVRKADSFSPLCMNTSPYGTMSVLYDGEQGRSEDCLYLNIWTPAKAATEKLPVFVILHGPSFGGSAPIIEGTALAKKGVVYVTLNFRVGIFAWLAHPDLDKEPGSNNSSGNYHYLDMIAALKWMQKNIAAFGGDPNNVTLWGEGNSEVWVSVLTASPLATGLFHKAGGETASPFLGDTSFAHNPSLTHAAALQAWVDWSKKNFNATTIAELRTRTPSDLLKVAPPYFNGRAFDGYVQPDYFDAIYAKGQQNDVPILIGWNKDEWVLNPQFSAAQASTVVSYTATIQARFGKFADQFLQLYPAKTDAEAVAQSNAYSTDVFGWAQWEWAKAHNQTGKTKAYVYHWTYMPPWKPGVKFSDGDAAQLGAYMFSEIPYILQTLNVHASQRQYMDADTKLSDMMSSYWVNFAKTGDPNGPGLPAWPAFDVKVDNSVMYLGAQTQAGPVPNKARLDFLETFLRSRALAASPSAPVSELAPTGKLRISLWIGNGNFITKDAKTGELSGTWPELAKELSARLGISYTIISTDTITGPNEAVKNKEADIAFTEKGIGLDDPNADVLDFTPPYLHVPLMILVPANSPIRTLADLNKPGVRISTVSGSAFEAIFARDYKQVQLVRGTAATIYDPLKTGQADAVFATLPGLLNFMGSSTDYRILTDPFAMNTQVIALPKGRSASLAFLNAFVEDVKASGLVQRLIDQSGRKGLVVPPKVP